MRVKSLPSGFAVKTPVVSSNVSRMPSRDQSGRFSLPPGRTLVSPDPVDLDNEDAFVVECEAAAVR